MKIYVTRHGQVRSYQNSTTDHMHPPGDNLLSDLGKEQARLLGIRLREMGFNGRIISSPYMRTLNTAEIIARETGCIVTPYAALREIIQSEGHAQNFKGLTIEEIREKYEFIDPEAELEYPWWKEDIDKPAKIEDFETDVLPRVIEGYNALLEKYKGTDLLLVCHGASVAGMHKILQIPSPKHTRTMNFNCSLSMIDIDNPSEKTLKFDTSHLTYETTTSNHMTREEYDAKHFEKEWEGELALPEEIGELTGTKILHIGDTYSADYPYYRKLIEEVKPDIILHTGDMSDEVKVGRIPGTEYEYISKITQLISVMNESGARLIIVPGNNDLPDEIKRLSPNAEIYPVNTVITIDGVECRIGHQVLRMTFDKKWSFYGHGLTGETWAPENNAVGGEIRLNVMHGSTVCSLSDGRFFRIPRP